MTGEELKAIRKAKGYSLQQMGLALGYSPNNKNTRSVIIRRMESGARAIPERKAIKAKEMMK